jgi:thioredoxin 1
MWPWVNKNNNKYKGDNFMKAIELKSNEFENVVLKSEKPVLVDFWAPWCGPCRMLAPVIEEIAEEYEGSIKVGKINVDEQGSLAMEFGVASIPTLILFKNGEIADTSVGFMSKEEIEKMLK